MKKFYLLIILCFFAISLKVKAQAFPVPENYSLKLKEDYPKYEKDVINTVDWLAQTPWSEQVEKRKMADSFIFQWVSGSPTINIVYREDILTKICTKNKEFFFSYTGGYLKYALQNKNEKDYFDENKAKLAGLRAVISKYNSEPDRVKDKNVEYLIKVDEEGKLEDWVTTFMKNGEQKQTLKSL